MQKLKWLLGWGIALLFLPLNLLTALFRLIEDHIISPVADYTWKLRRNQ